MIHQKFFFFFYLPEAESNKSIVGVSGKCLGLLEEVEITRERTAQRTELEVKNREGRTGRGLMKLSTALLSPCQKRTACRTHRM